MQDIVIVVADAQFDCDGEMPVKVKTTLTEQEISDVVVVVDDGENGPVG